MADILTESVCRAVKIAEGLVRLHGTCPDAYRSDAVNELLGTEIQALEALLGASNSLVERADEFRGLYPHEASKYRSGHSAASYHELGRSIATAVFMGTSRPLRDSPWPRGEVTYERLSNAADLSEVLAYLRNEAPRFDASELISCIRDEAVKADHRRGSAPEVATAAGPVVLKGKTKKPSTSARMIDLLKDPDTHTWSAQKFADKLGCSKSTVAGTTAWKQLQTAREMKRQQRGADKQTAWQRKCKGANVR